MDPSPCHVQLWPHVRASVAFSEGASGLRALRLVARSAGSSTFWGRATEHPLKSTPPMRSWESSRQPLIVTMSHTQFQPNLIDFDFLYSISFSSSLLAQQHSESLSWSPPLLPLCHHYFEGCIPLNVLLLWLEVSSWMLPLLKRWTHQWPSVLESLVMLSLQEHLLLVSAC